MQRGELKRLIDEAMICEHCGEPERPNDPVKDHIIPDKGSWPHRLHSMSCKNEWLAIHPRKFHEGENATLDWHLNHRRGSPVRKWRAMPFLDHGDPSVWILVIRPRFRTWVSQCLNSYCPHVTIEHDGAVLYDSRWDVPTGGPENVSHRLGP
jgi:hypothetical protein